MSIDFFETKCQSYSAKKLFGLCDDPSPLKNPAYIDEDNGAKWIAVVVNENLYEVRFTAIDNCVEIKKEENKMAKRCDGVLSYNSTITFVELKERDEKGNKWVKDAEGQLRATIEYFELTNESDSFKKKKAYIVNSERPKFREAQTTRMNQFFKETGYILRIESRIILE